MSSLLQVKMPMMEAIERLARQALAVSNHTEYLLAATVQQLSTGGDKAIFMRMIESMAMAQNHLVEVWA